MAQRQTTKNVDELRREFREVIKMIADVAVLQSSVSGAHKRIGELNRDIEKLHDKRDSDRKMLIGTLLSALSGLGAALFGLMKG